MSEPSFADVVSQGKARKDWIFMGDYIIRKVDKVINRGEDITVCEQRATTGNNRGCSREGRRDHWVVTQEIMFLCICERTMLRRRERRPSLVRIRG